MWTRYLYFSWNLSMHHFSVLKLNVQDVTPKFQKHSRSYDHEELGCSIILILCHPLVMCAVWQNGISPLPFDTAFRKAPCFGGWNECRLRFTHENMKTEIWLWFTPHEKNRILQVYNPKIVAYWRYLYLVPSVLYNTRTKRKIYNLKKLSSRLATWTCCLFRSRS